MMFFLWLFLAGLTFYILRSLYWLLVGGPEDEKKK